MKPIDIAVIIIVAVLAAAAIAYLAVRKLKGKSGCDCGGDCAACGMCKSDKSTDRKTANSDQPCPHCKDSQRKDG